MLAPDDRSVLLDLLRPPAGMRLDVGVATTFTLDLEAALVAPLAFASFDAAGPGDPIAALEAVRSVADRLTIFCQAGAMRVPQAASDLFAFLEPMVHEVRRPRPGFLFHPKLWALRFTDDDGHQAARLLVPTRNLTNDASWDAALRLDGPIGRPHGFNRPLADLVRWCLSNGVRPVAPDRAAAIEDLVETLRRVDWELPEDVLELSFHAMGIGTRHRPDFSGWRHLVVSPFVNDAGVEIVAPSTDVTIVSRPEQLNRLSPELVSTLDCRWLTSIDLDGTETAEAPLGDLHAKIIVAERGKRAHFFVGSANATDAAFSGNVEVLVELEAGRKKIGIDALLESLGGVLEPCNVDGGSEPSETDVLRRLAQNVLRDAAVIPIIVDASGHSSERSWTLAITSDRALVPDDLPGTATLELLTRPGFATQVKPGVPLAITLDGPPIADITPFVVLRLELVTEGASLRDACVIRSQLVGDPAERFDTVIARQVDTPAKFLRFLYLLLGLAGGGGVPPWLQGKGGDATGHGEINDSRLIELGVFEALMKALATNPSAIDDLDRLVSRLRTTEAGRATLPAGFDELWRVVNETRRGLAGGRR